jgi:uncharacterized repeat protein (TIGR01451 family)
MKRIFLIIFIQTLFLYHVKAQVAAMPFSPALDVFNPITGTVIDAPNADDFNYQNIPIGFDFNYAGNSFDTMVVSTNGFISFDSVPFTAWLFQALSSNYKNIIAPLNADLKRNLSNASLSYATIGSAPNRTCIIQWLHYSYFTNAQTSDISFQIWLSESTNCIKFIYGGNNYGPNPMLTRIGLKGSNNLDYIALKNHTCNWANAYPINNINASFPISLSCSMPSGFSFNFGMCNNENPFTIGYLTGKVFNDINGNGVLDNAEPGIPNHIVNIMPGNYYVSSNANGDYAFFFVDSSMTYNIAGAGINYWTQTNTPAVISCNPSSQSCSNLNLGYQAIPGIHEVEINCPSWTVRPGILEPYFINYQNNGTETESDTITFVMDSLLSFVSANPTPISVNGNTIQWAYSNLLPGQTGSINLNLMPSLNAVMGDTLYSVLSIAPLNDTVPSNNIVNLGQLVVNSYDPNDKLAEPSGMIEAGTEINYTIRFQNTGNAEAYNVAIVDTMDQNLDLMTFQFLGASHACVFTMEGLGIANFTFYNIMLPDSGTDMAGSNGYVSFKVKTKANLAPLTVINNTAGIYFDFNPPIITNTTADTIQMPVITGQLDRANTYFITAKPNPTDNNVVFSFSNDVNETASLTISTLEGKIVFNKINITSKDIINIADLGAGIYFCQIASKNYSGNIKIIKK